jgi:Mrr N-terminal domain
MMPVIRISENTWERLKEHARPLEDSVDDVLNRALDELDSSKGRATAVRKKTANELPKPRGRKLPQKEFRRPLLLVLKDLGGRARVADVRAAIEPKMASRLSDADYLPVSTGDPRWWNAVCWERNDLVKEGLLRNDSERGVWELSASGRQASAKTNADV